MVEEMCPYCNCIVDIEAKWEKQKCTECGEMIAPCGICEDMNCDDCPLGGDTNV